MRTKANAPPPLLALASARPRTLAVGGAGLVVALIVALTLVASARAATKVPLGTADSFAILAGAGITNTGATTITGDVGSFPTVAQTGFGTVTLNGVNHAGDAVTQGAKTDLVTAYNNAAGQTPATTVTGDTLGGLNLTPGVYSGGALDLTGTLTLNGGGNLDAVWVFKASSTLITASSSSVSLINGAQACNVFWQVTSSATLGSSSTLRGTVIALTDITMNTGATVIGRVLARNGEVTMIGNTITKPSTCTLQADADAAAAAAAAEAARVEAVAAAARAEAARVEAERAAEAARVEAAAAAAAKAEAARVAAVKAAAKAKAAAVKAAAAAKVAATAKAKAAAKAAAVTAAVAKKAAVKAATAAKAAKAAKVAAATAAAARAGFTG